MNSNKLIPTTSKTSNTSFNFLHSVNIEYINSFGAILNDSVLVYAYNESIPIKLENLESIILVKKRRYTYNFFFF